MKTPAILSVVIVLMMALCPAEAELVLVRDGSEAIPVVVAEAPPPGTVRAAEELVDYIERITGARPDLIQGRPEPVPDSAIWVGYQTLLDDLFPKLSFDFAHPEEILIAAEGKHLVIAGRDRWDDRQPILEPGEEIPRSVQQEFGTANAVYTFLQDYLGVRWFWPGPFGEDVPETDSVAFEPFEFRYHPQILARARLFRRSLPGGRGAAIEWSRFQRLLLDSLELHAYHAFTEWWERFHETAPDFFALQPDGTRDYVTRPSTVKMCVSNPSLWEQWLRDVEAALEENPNQVMFSASPNDGGYTGYCVCESCLAWDDPAGRMVRLHWEGLVQDYVSLSDRYVTFANTLGRLLKEKYPDRDLLVGLYAYGAYRIPPVTAMPDDNVVIGVVANFHNRPSAYDLGDHRDDLAGWAKVATHLLWRPNLAGHFRSGMLTVAPGEVIADMRWAAHQAVMAVDFDMLYEHWAVQGPHYYMLAQMTWNPYADGEAILSDYYERAFGPAAGKVRTYWELVEAVARRFIYEDVGMTEVWNDEFFQRAGAILDQADEILEGEPPIYQDRVGFVRVGLDYWNAMFEARQYMDRFRESGGVDTEAGEQALAVWLEKIRPLVLSEIYPHAINDSYARPGAGRVRDYHPEDLDWRREPWRRE